MEKCTLCNLGDNVPHQLLGRFVVNSENNEADVMIIGDFPHEEDYRTNRVFGGSYGSEISNIILKHGFKPENTYLTTLTKCRPVAPNNLDGILKKTNIEACSIYLIEEIVTLNPKLLILLGDKVYHFFYPDGSFTDNRGKIQKCEEYNINTIATYHPLAMVSASKFDQIINTDFKTAKNFLYGGDAEEEKPTKDYRNVTSLNLLNKIAERVKNVETFAFDIETHGEGLFNYKLLSIGLSWKEHTGVSIPIYVLDEDNAESLRKVRDYVIPERYKEETITLKSGVQKTKKIQIKGIQPEDYAYWRSILPEEYKDIINEEKSFTEIRREISAVLDQNPPLKRFWGENHSTVMGIIKDIMTCDTPKGAHNGSYDINRLRGKGIIVKNYAWDTILMHHMIDEERPHGLDDLSFVYTKDGGYKSGKNVYLESSKTSWANIPMDVLLPYNAQDADVTLQLYHVFKDIIYKEKNRQNLFEKHIMPAQRMLLDMEFRGSHVDTEWVKKTQQEYREKMKELKIKFSMLVEKVYPNVYVVDSPEEQKEVEDTIKKQAEEMKTEPKFPNFLNMNSTQQLIVLFRDYYKVPLTKKTKSGDALDADVLNKIGKKNEAANVLVEYKALKKIDSTYLDSLVQKVDADNKIHTQFLLYGTKTSRLSSKNPNLQNVPLSVKPMFVPPSNDYVCVNVDQSAAELHVLAWLANDKKMINIFENKRDLHKETAAGVFGKKLEDVTSDERKIAKRVSFGTAYGISGKGLADLLEPEGVKITESQGNKYIKRWCETYPSCANFLHKASSDYLRYGVLETAFGRRRHKFKKFSSPDKEAAAARQACNFPIQSTASDIQLYEMIHMYETLVANGILPVFTVHDSIVMYCPKNKLKWLRDYYKQETCRRFQQLNNLLMYTDMEVGRNYGEHVSLPYDCDFEKWCEDNKEIMG